MKHVLTRSWPDNREQRLKHHGNAMRELKKRFMSEPIKKISAVSRSVKSGAGFTLVELLTTIAIAGILLGAAVPSYVAMKNSVSLNDTAHEIAHALRTAQNLSLASVGNTTHAVSFNSAGTSYSLDSASTALTNNLKILTGANITVTFARLSGTPTFAPSTPAYFEVGYSSTRSKKITVSSIGKIDIQ